MSFRAYMILMLIGTGMSWASWVLVLFGVNPDESGFMGFVMFYLTLTMSLIGTLSVFELLVRKMLERDHLVLTRDVRTSFRHGVLLSLIIIISFILTTQGWFSWWVALAILVVTGCIEFLALVVQESRRG